MESYIEVEGGSIGLVGESGRGRGRGGIIHI